MILSLMMPWSSEPIPFHFSVTCILLLSAPLGAVHPKGTVFTFIIGWLLTNLIGKMKNDPMLATKDQAHLFLKVGRILWGVGRRESGSQEEKEPNRGQAILDRSISLFPLPCSWNLLCSYEEQWPLKDLFDGLDNSKCTVQVFIDQTDRPTSLRSLCLHGSFITSFALVNRHSAGCQGGIMKIKANRDLQPHSIRDSYLLLELSVRFSSSKPVSLSFLPIHFSKWRMVRKQNSSQICCSSARANFQEGSSSIQILSLCNQAVIY